MIKQILFITIIFSLSFVYISMNFLYKNMTFVFPEIEVNQADELEIYGLNKEIPDEIRDVTLEALSYFPELLDTKIHFQYKENIKGSVMQAQPKVGSLMLNNKKNRRYKIKISRYLQLEDELVPIEDLPHDVLLGWIGHELGHIKDYVNRSAVNLMGFGAKYYCSSRFISKAEIAADTYAVSCGLGDKLVATKNFVLNHERLPEAYKNKIRSLYMSPGEIMSMVEVEVVEESETD